MPSSDPIAPRWLKPRDAMIYSGMGRKMLNRLAAAGDIHATTTPGGHRRFDRLSMDRYFTRDREGESELALEILRSVGA